MSASGIGRFAGSGAGARDGKSVPVLGERRGANLRALVSGPNLCATFYLSLTAIIHDHSLTTESATP
jgi:hypothetical protein